MLFVAKDEIDPVDGKTKTCNRTKTFETFVDGGQMSADPGQAEKIGPGHDVRKGLGKIKGMFGKGRK